MEDKSLGGFGKSNRPNQMANVYFNYDPDIRNFVKLGSENIETGVAHYGSFKDFSFVKNANHESDFLKLMSCKRVTNKDYFAHAEFKKSNGLAFYFNFYNERAIQSFFHDAGINSGLELGDFVMNPIVIAYYRPKLKPMIDAFWFSNIGVKKNQEEILRDSGSRMIDTIRTNAGKIIRGGDVRKTKKLGSNRPKGPQEVFDRYHPEVIEDYFGDELSDVIIDLNLEDDKE